MTTFDEISTADILEEQLKIKSKIAKVCAEIRQHLQLENATLQRIIENKGGHLYHLVVDDEHRLLYCYSPKVASKNWLMFLVIYISLENKLFEIELYSN